MVIDGPTHLDLFVLEEDADGEDVPEEADQHRDRRHELLHDVGERLLHPHASFILRALCWCRICRAALKQ